MEVNRTNLFMKDSMLKLWTACFNVASGDVEDAPALDPLAKFEITEKNGAVYIKGDESTIKASRRTANVKCSKQGQEKVVIVGGYVTSMASQVQSVTHCVENAEAAVQSEQFKLSASRALKAP